MPLWGIYLQGDPSHIPLTEAVEAVGFITKGQATHPQPKFNVQQISKKVKCYGDYLRKNHHPIETFVLHNGHNIPVRTSPNGAADHSQGIHPLDQYAKE